MCCRATPVELSPTRVEAKLYATKHPTVCVHKLGQHRQQPTSIDDPTLVPRNVKPANSSMLYHASKRPCHT
eukprot:5096095-Amphidinium_carterae.1